jgi:hypothetical protein
MNQLTSLSVAQLKRAVALKEQIESLEQELAAVLGTAPAPKATVAAAGSRPRPLISAAGRARIAAAQRARWAKQKKSKASPAPAAKAAPASKPAKGQISAAGRARLSALAKARWAKAKKAGKTSLS